MKSYLDTFRETEKELTCKHIRYVCACGEARCACSCSRIHLLREVEACGVCTQTDGEPQLDALVGEEETQA